MKAIGVDIGTTTISLVVLDTEGNNVVEARTVSNGGFIRTANDWERIQDAEDMTRRAKEELDALLDAHPQVSSIGLTGQMHGILYVDGDGHSLSPLYSWEDQRGNLPEFASGTDENGRMTMVELIRARSGISAATGYGLVTHCYQNLKGLTPKGAAAVCTIPDYLGMVLTGRRKPLLHASMAASIGFFDSEHGTFLRDRLEAVGADSSILPEVTDQFAALGSYRGIPVTAALGDNQASFLGSAGTEADTMLVNVGTSGQISVLSKQWFTAPGIESRPFMAGQYLLAGSTLCGGRAYAMMERFFRIYLEAAGAEAGSQFALMGRLAQQALEERQRQESGKGTLRVTTTFGGTRVDPNERGSITGIDEDNFTPQNLIFGVLEGVARELYDMYHIICEGTGIHATRMVASGNALRKNAVLRQIFEQMFQAEVTPARYEEEAACGAAISSCYLSNSHS